MVNKYKTSIRVSELLFAVNLGFAISLLLVIILVGRRIKSGSVFPDAFSKVIFTINDWFRLNRLDALGEDIALSALVILFSLVFWVLLQSLNRGRTRVVVLNFLAPLTALAAVPIAWCFYNPTTGGSFSLGWNPWRWFFAAFEISLVLSFLRFLRTSRIGSMALIVLHYSIWCWALWYYCGWDRFFWERSAQPLASAWPVILSVVSPCAALVWLLDRGHRRTGAASV